MKAPKNLVHFKKLLPFGEFAVVTLLSGCDPFLGFWANVLILVWHLIQEEGE